VAGINSNEGDIRTQNANRQLGAVWSRINFLITAPSMALVPYHALAMPCITPRLRRGVGSKVKKVAALIMPPQPIPANTRPRIMVYWFVDSPQIKLPMAKERSLAARLRRRPEMSVSLLAAGCTAAFEIRYAMAIWGRSLSDCESNSRERGAERVSVMVESSEGSTGRC
jgi:hypothetical protein